MVKEIFKKCIKLIAPPLFFYLPHLIKIIRFQNNIYWGIFSSNDEIKKKFKTTSYVGHKKNQAYFINFKNQKFNFNKKQNVFLPIFISNIKLKHINILDIGGGYNSVYYYLKDTVNQKFNVTVLETKMVLDTLNNSKINIGPKYVSTFEEVDSNQYEVVYFGSSFQYFLEIDHLLLKVFSLNPLYIIITDCVFLEKKESFLSLQVNIYPSLFVQRFNNLKEIIKIMNNHNYKIIYNSKRKSQKHNLLKSNECFLRDLIFKKK
jgi:putative methyltransferase (TIGR04325 family)